MKISFPDALSPIFLGEVRKREKEKGTFLSLFPYLE
jgi:hypothetical protein